MTRTEHWTWRQAAIIGAGFGPLVSAFLYRTYHDPQLNALWSTPSIACAASAIGGAAVGAGTYWLLQKPRSLSPGSLVVLAVAMAGLLILLAASHTAQPFSTGVGFIGLTMLATSSLLNFRSVRRARRDLASSQSKVRALEMQLNPHFFFNTLNTISALVKERPDQAQQTIHELADLFRHTMDTARRDWIPLESELNFVRGYLNIEKARFGDRLRFTLPEHVRFEIPGLTLQPIVENAIRHGIAKLIDGGEIRVVLDGMDLHVISPVEDVRHLKPEQFFQEGHSLQMVRDRLQLLTNGRARIGVDIGLDTVEVSLYSCVR